MENSTLCINCEKSTVGKFCHHCGQKQGVSRLTWYSIFGELQKRIFGFDNNYLRTVKDLTIRPQAVINSIIEGNRVKYVGPVGYYFVMLTIYILVMSILDIDMAEMMGYVHSSINEDESQRAMQMQLNQYIGDNFRLTAFLMMPFFILGVWIIFKNKGYNFLETSVINFYGQAHPLWASIVFMFVYKITGDSTSFFVMSFITYFYLVIIITAFYKGNKLWNFIKAIISLVLGLVLLMILAMLIGFIAAIINPEMMKGFAG
ncbi:hypothetical protein GCM10011506_37730 [Marivirga lumbricoides]|uniref:DUF3667 domain-containing protein n=1 Tax=Marivirga lumbricoides TaxID=1046115 RepID=A0A2T4DRH3_9BACT|nr:hypothetical protein C9994_07435 [Marivirga lumbricoides]GGC48534.1 hypothetical protein GCM10011506_37730 [Marivirga lumbricoides]